MLKFYHLLILLSFGLILPGCSSAPPQNLNAEISSENSPAPTPTPQNENLPQSAEVKFKGVSFTYNPRIFSQVAGQEVAELPLDSKTDKPDSVMPKHILFPVKLVNTKREGTIQIIPIDDYRRMYDVSDEDVKNFDNQLKVIKKDVRGKNFSKRNYIPILPFWDAHNVLIAKVKRNLFQEGRGIFWLTQWSQDFADLVNNEKLTLMYQGISDDDKYYILAEFPVNVSFLPDSADVQEFEGYRLPTNTDEFEKHRKEYENYILNLAKRLEVLPQKEFESNLDEFEKIISSLKIEK